MSQENVVVRTPMTSAVHPRRRLEQHLGLRFPRLLKFVSRRVWRLPPWRLRRAFLRRSLRMGWEALNRRDLEACFMLYHPKCESIFPTEFRAVGFSVPGTRSRDERIRAQREGFDDWGGSLHFEPQEVIEVGDRLLSLGRMKGTGPTSGAAVDMDWVAMLTTRDGRVIREEIFLDRRKALEAAGLSE